MFIFILTMQKTYGFYDKDIFHDRVYDQTKMFSISSSQPTIELVFTYKFYL